MTPAAKPSPILDSFRRVTPSVKVAGAVEALEFYGAVFGATLQRPEKDQFYGDRDGYIVDPFGHGSIIASHIEDVTPDEMTRRMAKLFDSAGSSPRWPAKQARGSEK